MQTDSFFEIIVPIRAGTEAGVSHTFVQTTTFSFTEWAQRVGDAVRDLRVQAFDIH